MALNAKYGNTMAQNFFLRNGQKACCSVCGAKKPDAKKNKATQY